MEELETITNGSETRRHEVGTTLPEGFRHMTYAERIADNLETWATYNCNNEEMYNDLREAARFIGSTG